MEIKDFEIERYFAKYEFSVKYQLSPSDCEPISQKKLVDMANPQVRSLWDNLSLGYTESRGNPLLRAEIAGLYGGLKDDNVLVAAPEEGIFLAMNTILSSGDHVIAPYPAYQSLYEIAKGLGCEVTPWRGEEQDGWKFDPNFLKDAMRPNTKLVVMNFPHNPTGYLPSPKEFREMVGIVAGQGAYLFSDEMYRMLEYDHQDRLPSATQEYDKAVSLSGMSKVFGLPGLRIGWLTSQDKKLMDKVANFKDYTTICSSAPSEILAIIGLQNRDDIIRGNVQRILENMEIFDDFTTRHQDLFTWIKPKAGSIAFPKIRSGEDSYQFCERVVSEAGVLVIPSSVFDYDRQHIRVGFGRAAFPEALNVLEGYLFRS